MPNMDGLQMLAQLQTNDQWKQIPVVMISTESSQTKVMEALRLGAKGFIRKPFVPDEVGEKLASFVQ
jgi:two-component system chemotaxis response regulator CheY